MINRSPTSLISATQFWLEHIVIGENFCPFAKKEFERQRIRYQVFPVSSLSHLIELMAKEYRCLDVTPDVETTLVILTSQDTQKTIDVSDFDEFLLTVEELNLQLQRSGYEGVYQLATFHPDYRFADEAPDSPSHYTNRSPYPMLHIIRECSIERALKTYKAPEQIPERNIARAKQRGVSYFQQMLSKSVQR